MEKLINVGYGNCINSAKVISVVSVDSAPVKRAVQNAKEADRIIDATQGRKTKSVVVMDGGYLVLSALIPETIVSRFNDTEKESNNLKGRQDE